MSGRFPAGKFPGLKRLYNALAGDIRDKDENPAKHGIMRSRAFVTTMHKNSAAKDQQPNHMLEWMVARRNIDGSWRVFMESGVASGRKHNKFVMRNTRSVARETGFGIAAELIRNYETRMGQVYTQFKAAKPTCDHVSFVAPEPENKPRKMPVPRP